MAIGQKNGSQMERRKELVQTRSPTRKPLVSAFSALVTASLPERISQVAGGVVVDIYADNLTAMFSTHSAEKAATLIQPSLNAITGCSKNHYMKVNLDPRKTEASVVSLDPRETEGKAQPLYMNGNGICYYKNPVILCNISAPSGKTDSEPKTWHSFTKRSYSSSKVEVREQLSNQVHSGCTHKRSSNTKNPKFPFTS